MKCFGLYNTKNIRRVIADNLKENLNEKCNYLFIKISQELLYIYDLGILNLTKNC